jgi:hypothetical protein
LGPLCVALLVTLREAIYKSLSAPLLLGHLAHEVLLHVLGNLISHFFFLSRSLLVGR